MKTIIAYASKHGNTARIASRAAQKLPGSVLVDLGREKLPALAATDTLVLMSPVYMGRPRSQFGKTLAKVIGSPAVPRLAVVTCGMDKEGDDRAKITASAGEQAVAKADLVLRIPGIMPTSNLGFFEGMIIKAVQKAEAEKGAPDPSIRTDAEEAALAKLVTWASTARGA